MESLHFPLGKDGPLLEVVIGLDDQESVRLLKLGAAIAPPLRLRALIDTGADLTAVTPAALHQLGIVSVGSASTQTASGRSSVRLFEVSLSISGPLGAAGPMLVRESIRVTELTATLPVDVLIGLDVLSQCLLILDGPGKQFTLAF